MKSSPNTENLPPGSLSYHYFSGKNYLVSETPDTGSPRPQCKAGPGIAIYVEANVCFLVVPYLIS